MGLCFQTGGHHNVSGDVVSVLANGTGRRVWLHQNPIGTGWGDCFSSGSAYLLSGRDTRPGDIQITGNKNPC